MPWNDQLTQLNQILAQLYPNREQSYRIVDMAGIRLGTINFKDVPIDNWYYILKEADKRDKVEELVQVVINEYPNREDLKNLFLRATERNPMQPVEQVYMSTLKSLLMEGKIDVAINELEKIAKEISSDLHNNVVHQSGRYRRVVKDRQKGVIGEENYQLAVNKINYALLDFIDDIPENDQIKATRSILKKINTNLSTVNTLDFEKIMGREELFEINWLYKAIKASKSVCKVLTSRGKSGTGFILRGGYLLTNHHILETAHIASNAKVIFNYQVDGNGIPRPTKEYYLDTTFFKTSPFDNLDYSLVKIKDPDSDLSKWGHLTLEKFLEPSNGERVNIIQHPDGKSMKIALPDNIISKWKQYLFYIADTKPGSSGSPVFNQEWKVVALHHAGKDEHSREGGYQINEQGNIRPSNRGILIKQILSDLIAQGVSKEIIAQL